MSSSRTSSNIPSGWFAYSKGLENSLGHQASKLFLEALFCHGKYNTMLAVMGWACPCHIPKCFKRKSESTLQLQVYSSKHTLRFCIPTLNWVCSSSKTSILVRTEVTATFCISRQELSNRLLLRLDIQCSRKLTATLKMYKLKGIPAFNFR